MCLVAGSCVVAGVLVTPAQATYSISAVDTATRQVGGAGTSCISGQSVYLIYGSAPGFGAVNSQARASTTGRDEAVRLLRLGVPPAEIVERITDPDFDFSAASRQYGIVDLQGRAAGHSGTRTSEFSDDIQGSFETFAFSIQGNILTGEAVLTQARTAFVEGGCDLAERLISALEGGAENNQGDSRCTPDGIPSDAAYIQVDLPDEDRGSFLRLEVRDTVPESPVALLRERFDEWRQTHPCPPSSPPDAGMPDASTTPPVDAGADAGAEAGDDAPAVEAGVEAGTDTGSETRSEAGAAGPDAEPANQSGCACRTHGPSQDPQGLLAAFALALFLRRGAARARSRPPA
jgi:uncharacterized Ntn-hydrolase superfamily protein